MSLSTPTAIVAAGIIVGAAILTTGVATRKPDPRITVQLDGVSIVDERAGKVYNCRKQTDARLGCLDLVSNEWVSYKTALER